MKMEENMTKQASPKEILTSVDTSHENSFGKKGTSPKPKKKKKNVPRRLKLSEKWDKNKSQRTLWPRKPNRIHGNWRCTLSAATLRETVKCIQARMQDQRRQDKLVTILIVGAQKSIFTPTIELYEQKKI